MQLLIDGYNLFKYILQRTCVSEQEMKHLLNVMDNYNKKKNFSITIVFDGGTIPYAYTTHWHTLRVIYSGYKQSADTVIKNIVQEATTKQMLLITSDNELRAFAKHCGLESLTTPDFYAKIKESMHSKQPKKENVSDAIVKFQNESTGAVDALMEQYSQKIPKKIDDLVEVKYVQKDEQSKKEKQRHKILKKL